MTIRNRTKFRKRKSVFENGRWQAAMTEEHVVRQITEGLWLHGVKVHRINQPVGGLTRQNVPGIPDLVGWIPYKGNEAGRSAMPLYIEVKRPGGARRPAQILFIEEAKRDGCVAFFAESWDDVVGNFAALGIALAR